MSKLFTTLFSLSLFWSAVTIAQEGQWSPVTGAQTLRDFMSGLTAERTLAGGETAKAEYSSDGTGILTEWGTSFTRDWEVQDENKICISSERESGCYLLEKSVTADDLYRVKGTKSNQYYEFRTTGKRAVATGSPSETGSKGGAAAASADELAAELSNPNTAVASLSIKNQYRWYDGDAPGAGEQSNYTLLFQPVLPFVLDSGDKIIWRPAIPFQADLPQASGGGGFEGVSGMGDFAFDLAYAPKLEGGRLFALGLITSLPTATNDLGSDRWTIGPEMLIGQASSKNVWGFLPAHQWDAGGPGDADISLTTITAFYVHLPGGGWNYGTGPIMSYDWNAEQWTIPLQFNVGKTVMLNGRPWKFNAEVNYYVEKPDAFGPEWMIAFNITPVVKNGLAKWFGLGN